MNLNKIISQHIDKRTIKNLIPGGLTNDNFIKLDPTDPRIVAPLEELKKILNND